MNSRGSRRSRTPSCLARLGGALLVLGSAGVSTTARADDRGLALEILRTLTASTPQPTDDAVKQAREALERGTRMRNAGDIAHAQLAEGLALEWAEAARERARTEAVEKEARTSELAAIEAGARVERERALLEEAIARSGRLRAELASLTTKDSTAKTKDRTSALTAGDAATKPGAARAPKAPRGVSPASAPAHVDADAPSSDGPNSASKGAR